MLEFLFRPLRSALGGAEHEVAAPFAGTEREIVHVVDAVHRAAEAVERHIETVEGLATAVGPLTESVNRLTEAMAGLVELLAPMAAVERDVEEVRRLFRLRRRAKPAEHASEQPEL